MLSAERAFVFFDQQGGLVSHLAEFLFALSIFNVDDRPQVQFPRADMGMVDATQAEVFKHLGEVGHISGKLFRGYRRVFDDADGLGIAFHTREQAQARFAQAPYFADFVAINS